MRQARQQRELDTVFVENPDVGIFEVFNGLSVTNDLTRPSEASFEVGNDSSFNDFIVQGMNLGALMNIWVNNRLHLSGRVEMASAPLSPENGVPMQFVVRTKLADALYASANPAVRASKGTTIKDFVLEVFSPLGYTEADFYFQQDLARDILTGKKSDGSESPVPIDDLKEEALKVNPPETIYAAADRILKRHGLMLWDAPDGKIIIGAPNDDQYPAYSFFMNTDQKGRQRNNVLNATRTRDFSQAPALLGVYGIGGKKNWRKSKVSNVQILNDVYDIQNRDGSRAFYRPVLLVNEGVKTDELAERHASRELTNRSKQVDTWDMEVDGLSYWDGSVNIPFGPDTIAEVTSELAGGPNGAYLVTKVTKSRNTQTGDTTRLTLLKRGLWVL